MSRTGLVKRRRPKKQIHGAHILQPNSRLSSAMTPHLASVSLCIRFQSAFHARFPSCIIDFLFSKPPFRPTRICSMSAPYMRTDSYMKVFASLTLQDVVDYSLPFTSAPARVIKAHRFNLLDHQTACVRSVANSQTGPPGSNVPPSYLPSTRLKSHATL
jgi:hypothetical protein